ncbi:MAG: TolC family protein [Epulopiscium sp.]|nr:TolC family protein [Candidatus Epulonipiscium sp.]
MKKPLKKITSIVLAMAMISSVAPVYGANIPTLQVNGISQPLQVSPIIEDNTRLVGLREIFEALGTTVSWNKDTGAIVAKNIDTEIKLIPGRKIAYKNGTQVELTAAPKRVDGNIMVPLCFVGELFGAEVIWDSDNNIIQIDTTPEKPVEEVKLVEYPVLTINEIGTKITYRQAIDKALKNNVSLKILEEQAKTIEEQQKNARNAVIINALPSDGVNAIPEQMIQENLAHLGAISALVQTDYGVEAQKYQREITEGAIKYQVKVYFDSIKSLKKAIELSSKALELDKTNLDITKKKAELGQESGYNKIKAEQDYSKKQRELELLKKNLDDLYIYLNRLIGANEKERFVLDYNAEYTPMDMDEIQLNAFIERALVRDPSIMLQKENVKVAEFNLNSYVNITGQVSVNDSWNMRNNALAKTKLEETQAKQNLRDNLNTTYNEIKRLEEKYEVNALALKQAKAQYDILKAQYDLGMIIEANLKEGELAILMAQIELEETIANHAQKLYTFNNSFLLTR